MDKYYIGLDIGTNSVGWACTDEKYNLIKSHGKLMWGIRLFNESKTAAERRIFRSTRRRIKRRKLRLKSLREIFSDEINKIDKDFFDRLDDSFFYPDDKKINQKYSLFNDPDYTDKDYYKQFPTIYHLKKYLIEGNKPRDIRFVFLALNHYFGNRGHFLFNQLSVNEISGFEEQFTALKELLNDNEITLELKCDIKEFESILTNQKYKKKVKSKNLNENIITNDNKKIKILMELLSGQNKDVLEFFDNYDLEFKLTFDDEKYDEKRQGLYNIIGDDIEIIDVLKSIYDWEKLYNILKESKYISFAKVKSYDEHKNNLEDIKYLLKKYLKDEYSEIFKKEIVEKEIKKILENISVEEADVEKYKNILEKLELGIALPKQRTVENSLVPYQLNLIEIEKILDNCSEYFECVKENRDKIIEIFKFKIPYYIGPLSTKSKNAWLVKNNDEKITPFNFDSVIDTKQTSINFIENLISRCTYLKNEKVLPKYSILFSKFEVLNEINTIKLDGINLSVELKQDIFNDLYLNNKKITIKKLKNYLNQKNLKYDNISGLNNELKNFMESYNDFYQIIGEKLKYDKYIEAVEECIKLITIFNEEKNMLSEKIKQNYSSLFTDEEIEKICKLNYSGWARLSSKFLNLVGTNQSTGEMKSIIEIMWEENLNLNQIIYHKDFEFNNIIDKFNDKNSNEFKFDYNELLDETYLSPAVKSSVWQTLKIVREIVKIKGYEPEKIFVEMARGSEGNEKKETVSRKNKLKELYSKIKDSQYDSLKDKLEKTNEGELKSIKLYLYFTQLGKSMYTGKSINLDELNNYDRDHIIPRSLLKDDSLDNLVLVEKTENAEKRNSRLSDEIRKRQKPFWDLLYKNGLISEIKYEKLNKGGDFTEEELSSFIARQLVETRQSTKMVCKIFENMFDNSKVIYVKSRLNSEFRHNFGHLKSRDINDFHHAHDAYLSIITGNVHYNKFTKNPINFIGDKKYNIDTKVVYGDKEFEYWNKEEVKKNIENYFYTKVPLYTKKSEIVTGEFYDQTRYDTKKVKKAKGKGYIPFKTKDSRYSKMDRYGGFCTVKSSNYFIVEHYVKNNKVRTIEPLPIYLKDVYNTKEKLEKYCVEELKLINPSVRMECLKQGSLLKINGFLYNLGGRTKNDLYLEKAINLVLNKDDFKYLRKIYLFNAANKYDSDINKENNLKIYDGLVEKLENSIYRNLNIKLEDSKKVKKSLIDIFKNGREKFIDFEINDQIKFIIELVKIFKAGNNSLNLSLFNYSSNSGKKTINKIISNTESIILINQSITGIYESEVDLKKV